MTLVQDAGVHAESTDVFAGLVDIVALFEFGRALHAIRTGTQASSGTDRRVEFTSLEQAILEGVSISSVCLEDFVESLVRRPMWRQILAKWAQGTLKK